MESLVLLLMFDLNDRGEVNKHGISCSITYVWFEWSQYYTSISMVKLGSDYIFHLTILGVLYLHCKYCQAGPDPQYCLASQLCTLLLNLKSWSFNVCGCGIRAGINFHTIWDKKLMHFTIFYVLGTGNCQEATTAKSDCFLTLQRVIGLPH